MCQKMDLNFYVIKSASHEIKNLMDQKITNSPVEQEIKALLIHGMNHLLSEVTKLTLRGLIAIGKS